MLKFLPTRSGRRPRTHFFRWRILILVLIVILLQQHHKFIRHTNSLAAKYAPTEFDTAFDDIPPTSLDDEDAQFHNDLIVNRQSWKVLGSGYEGQVFAYKGSVIKTFTPGRSPFRNCLPGVDGGERWPTEIAASLKFGGSLPGNDSLESVQRLSKGFLPVQTYFKAATTAPGVDEWHLVTPRVEGGNLKHLAKKIKSSSYKPETREIDLHYRPVFEGLLHYLQELHDAGYCHDDMKPANVFVESETDWLLGDLGNLREVNHPYHSSKLWSDNKQLSDCRANDVIRALKSYLHFIRTATSNRMQFDEDFLRGQDPLSRLYWSAIALAPMMNAEELRKFSKVEDPGKDYTSYGDDVLHTSNYGRMERYSLPSINRGFIVTRALETRMGEKIARWHAFTWLFGIPLADCCAAR